MAFDINQFKSRGLTKGGARPSLFEVKLNAPFATDSTILEKFSFTCRSAQLPASTVGSIGVPYFGRSINVGGDRTFTDWNVTVINDEDYIVRDMFESWSNQINTMASNEKILAGLSYKSQDAVVTHYSKDMSAIRQYKFVGIFPTAISAMNMDWESRDQLQTFDVTFSYDYWIPLPAESGLAQLDVGVSS